MSIWVNGRRRQCIDPRDRGLQYGDGLFETMRVGRGTVRLLDHHLERLYAGCRRLRIVAPDERRLRREILALAARTSPSVLKLIVTRGIGKRGYRPTGRERCTRILMLSPLPRAARRPAAPIKLRICTTRLAANPRLAGMKTLNRLESVIARSEWHDVRVAEGLMLSDEGDVVCGTMSNLFLRRGRLLLTPALDRCGVAGVMRRWVLEQAPELGLRALERRIRLRDLELAEEVFMTNALAGPMPVAEIRDGARRIRPPGRETAAVLLERLERL